MNNEKTKEADSEERKKQRRSIGRERICERKR
jgi:hypothetical protein